jgi:hypothetical protein
MHSQKRFPVIQLPLLLLAINQAHANQFEANVSARTLLSDNTKKTSIEEPIEERQDIYQVGLKGNHSNWLVEANVDYQLYAHKFAEHSQPDEEYADGGATLIFGKEQDPLGLELSHTRRMLLQSPSDVVLLENLQEREIISAQPILRKRISGADWIYVRGRAENVRFLTDDNNQDSNRNGGSFGWAHAISKTSALNLGAQYTDVSFDQSPTSDYSLSSVNLAYTKKLRRLDYVIDIGYNETKPEVGEKQGAPTYNISVGYDTGLYLLEAHAERLITDTSFGSGNVIRPGQIPGTDGFAPDLGKIDRRTFGLDFSTKVFCSRCTLTLGASLTDDDYLEREKELRSIYYRSKFVYALSTASSISLQLDRIDYEQEGDQFNTDYKTDYLALEYVHRFVNGFDIKLFGRTEQRKADEPETNYKENIVGIGLGFVF